MKVLIFFIVNILLVYCQLDADVIRRAAALAASLAQGPTWCIIGTIATVPPNPVSCVNLNEIFACAYGEARCDGLGYCGTPPCTWRCWCKNGYKRDINGKCVKNCLHFVFPRFPFGNWFPFSWIAQYEEAVASAAAALKATG
jgi:hypothetical protein